MANGDDALIYMHADCWNALGAYIDANGACEHDEREGGGGGERESCGINCRFPLPRRTESQFQSGKLFVCVRAS